MNLQQRINRMLEKKDDPMAWFWAAVITGHDCICEEGLFCEQERFDIIRRFVEDAAVTVNPTDDGNVLSAVSDCLERILKNKGYPENAMPGALSQIRSLFLEERIRNTEDMGETEESGEDIITPGIYDLHCLELAYLFADISVSGAERDFLASIQIESDTENVRSSMFFAEQILAEPGSGKIRTPNLSGERAYNRIRRPEMLLWMYTVLGEDQNLIRVINEKKREGSPAARCAAFRKEIPFSRVFDLAYEFFFEEAED